MFDTHAHLDQEGFDADRCSVIARARAVGVDEILLVGCTVASSRRAIEIATPDPQLYAAVGLQPNYVASVGADDWQQIVDLASDPKVVALGETGLDRYWDDSPFDVQQDYFDRHLRLSRSINKPVVIHLRDCEEDILVMLREARRRGPVTGVMHSYTGTAAGAAECVDLGLYISFAGMVTYKKSDELRGVAATVPLDRLLVETDSPYLSPEPLRKVRRNEPAHVVHTVECLANLRGVTARQMAEQTTANARRLFRISN